MAAPRPPASPCDHVGVTDLLAGACLEAFVAATDLDRSRSFYEGVLGGSVLGDNGLALLVELGGTTVRVTRVDEPVVAPYTVLGWTVPDIDATVRGLTDQGVEPVRYEQFDQDGLGIWTAPGGDRIAWFRDPDGHLLSVQEPA